jgi:hypothetical protein
MQKSLFTFLCLLLTVNSSFARLLDKPVFSGMYFQWGYNRDWYSKSDLHFKNGNKYDFTIYDAKAKDKPDFSGFWSNPIDITIPQNSYRIGVYLNKKHTHAIEINYDHAKYVVTDNQYLRIKGQLNGEAIDKVDTIRPYFMHLEHTNGANFYHINYVGQHALLTHKKKGYTRASVIWKAGAGIVVPKSDIILQGKRLDNKFHVAGYILGLEGGLRYYPFRNFFLEATVKGGHANYMNVLTVGDGGKISHKFNYAEVIGLIGYDINFQKRKKKDKETVK